MARRRVLSIGEIKRRAGRKARPPSLLEKITAYQTAIRDLDLTLHEWALLTVVVDRTIGWGKRHREITLEELTTRCRISARSVRRASAGLVKADLIEVLFTGRTNRYGVTEAMGGPVKLPKRLKGEEPQPGQWGQPSQRACITQPGCVYKITHHDSGMVYVGQTLFPSQRWKQHRTGAGGGALAAAIRSYGEDEFEFEVIHHSVVDPKELDRLEAQEIERHSATDPAKGYNIRTVARGRVAREAEQIIPKGQGVYKNNIPRDDEPIQKTVPPSKDGGRALASPRKRTRPVGAVEAVEQERAKGRDRKTQQITTTKPGDLWRTWEDAHAECGLSQPVGWGTKAMQAKVKRFVEAFPDDKASELHAFLNWVVYEWRGAVARELSWMDDFPSMPVVGLMLGQLERLVVLWRGGGVKVGEEWRSGPHAEEIEDLLMDGNSERAKELMRAT